MSKVTLPRALPDQRLVLELGAAKSFTEGELGLATACGVVAVDLSQGVAPDCFLVRAVAPVRRGQFGKFVETHSVVFHSGTVGQSVAQVVQPIVTTGRV